MDDIDNIVDGILKEHGKYPYCNQDNDNNWRMIKQLLSKYYDDKDYIQNIYNINNNDFLLMFDSKDNIYYRVNNKLYIIAIKELNDVFNKYSSPLKDIPDDDIMIYLLRIKSIYQYTSDAKYSLDDSTNYKYMSARIFFICLHLSKNRYQKYFETWKCI
jgi:hypothetical protein